ncbi:MAG: type I 3-dehydroquinate dehydratase [Roseburia sp.]|nr:type I 3-dehydroquinate dehydratase [Roseburia sp.]
MSQITIKNHTIGNGRPLVCVPVMERTKEEIIEEMICLSDSCADMIEWRIDAFSDFTDYNAVRDILQVAAPHLSDKVFLYTFRTKKQGGMAQVSEEVLNDLHDLAVESKCVDLIDLEYFEEEHPLRKIRKLQKEGVKVVASHHDFDATPEPEVMNMLLERMYEGGADIVKLAVMPNSRKDVLNLLEATDLFLQEHPDTPIITMSMGSLGSISRLCGEHFGSCVTFGSHKMASAPGQFEMNHLREILDAIHESNR